jgi:hypothetical protein
MKKARWRECLYFSSGERQALAILLLLITAAWLLITFTFVPEEAPPAELTEAPRVETPQVAVTGDTSKPGAKVRPFYQKPAERKLRYPRREKFPAGTIVELNRADTATLQKVPGIGSTFSRRIVGYRRILGGYYTVEQLSEVYGIDEDRYEELKGWFRVDTTLIRKLPVNSLPVDSLGRHPYLSYKEARQLKRCARKLGRPLRGWEDLDSLPQYNVFTESDRERLSPYLSFDSP